MMRPQSTESGLEIILWAFLNDPWKTQFRPERQNEMNPFLSEASLEQWRSCRGQQVQGNIVSWAGADLQLTALSVLNIHIRQGVSLQSVTSHLTAELTWALSNWSKAEIYSGNIF